MIFTPTVPNASESFLLRLYEQYSDYIYKLAWELCPNSQDVDDLVQTVWEKLIRKEHILRNLDQPQHLNYISKTLKNTLREDARKKKFLTCSLDSIVGYSHGRIDLVDESIDKGIQSRQFQTVWPQVDEDIRELLERKYDLDETDEEIARSMGIKAASVRMYLSRARKAARKILANHKSQLLR